MRAARRRVTAWLARPLLWAFIHTPEPILQPMLRFLFARPLYWANRKAALRNLELAFGDRFTDRERRRIALRSCESLARALGEVLVAARIGVDRVLERIDAGDMPAKFRACEEAQESGLIGLTGHIGNWELLSPWTGSVGHNGIPLAIAKRTPNPHLNAMVERLRAKIGVETIYQDDSPSQAIRALRKGRNLGIVPDQDVKTLSGMFIEFLGRPAYTPVGPARIAIAAKAPILPTILYREGKRLRVRIFDPIRPDLSLSRDAQIAQLTKAWSSVLEDFIRENPEQWPWIHNRWRTTPEKLEARGRRHLIADACD